MPTSSEARLPEIAKQRGKHYCQTVVFEVGGFIHRVPRHGLEEYSGLFRDMFTLPQPTQGGDGDKAEWTREGDTDDNPIRLVGCTNEEFEDLIEVLYQLLGKAPELSKEKWIGVLKLARLWDIPQIADMAIEKVTQFGMQPVEMVKLGKEYGVPMWLKVGYTTLVSDVSKVSLSEMQDLGWETAFRILWARDGIARLDTTQTTSDGYWIKKESLSCGGCWRNWGTVFPINDNAASCSNCGNSYGWTDHGVHIALPYTSLGSGPPEPRPDASTKAVIEKVVEVFGEDLKDAERRNAPAAI